MSAPTYPVSTPRLPERLDKELRVDYLIYIRSNEYLQFLQRLNKPLEWWNLFGKLKRRRADKQFQKAMEDLVIHGQPAVGLVVMRNMVLEDPEAVAPVLILASTDVTPSGFRELLDTLDRIEQCRDSSDPEVRRQIEAIFEDDTYQLFILDDRQAADIMFIKNCRYFLDKIEGVPSNHISRHD